MRALVFLLVVQVAMASKFTCVCTSEDEPLPTPTPMPMLPLPAPSPPAPAVVVPKPCPNAETAKPTPKPTVKPAPNADVRLFRGPYKCISIYGLETNLRNTVCSWKHPAAYYIEKVKSVGFDTLRVPISIQYITESNYEVLDSVFHSAEEHNMKIILDFHRVGNNRQEETWDKGIEENNFVSSHDEMINLMLTVISRYSESRSLIGMNSWNEYTGRDVNYKKKWDMDVFNQIEKTYPGRFVFFAVGLFWGNTLNGYSLEELPYKDRIMYGVHKYHFSGSGDRADWESSFGNSFPPDKIMIGEYGFRDPEDMWWGKSFVAYLQEKKIKNHCFWTIAHSGDTGGLWSDNCEDMNQNKLNILKPLLN